MSKTVGGKKTLPSRSLFVIPAICLATLVIILLLLGCPANPSLTIAFLGDINLGRDVAPNSDSFLYLQENLSRADIVLANLESPLGIGMDGSTSGYNLCAPKEHAAFLSDWGINFLSLANNHSNDCSPKGIEITQSFLNAVGIIGINSNPYQINIHGIDVTIFAFDDITIEIDQETAAAAITTASVNNSFVIVSMHWGMEYQGAPSQRQKNLATALAEAGADVIWGHHPHVLQPVECIETPWGSTLVLYSLGNAMFDQGGLANTRQSSLILMNLDDGRVKSVEAVPFEIDVPVSTLKTPSAEIQEEILLRLAIPTDLFPSR